MKSKFKWVVLGAIEELNLECTGCHQIIDPSDTKDAVTRCSECRRCDTEFNQESKKEESLLNDVTNFLSCFNGGCYENV